MGTRRRPATDSAGIGEAVHPGRRCAGRGAMGGRPRRFPGGRLASLLAAFWLSSLPAPPVRAQGTEARPDQPGDAPPLSASYQLSERYGVEPDAKKPEALTQYRVGSRETVKIVRDRPQGAPDRVESSLQMIYTERVVKVARDGKVSDVVRHYDRVNFRTTLPIRPFKTKWLEGMTILYRLSSRYMPTVVSLSDRTIRQQEFQRISEQAFLPELKTILPRKPIRVGDTWPVPKSAVWAMIGAMPVDDNFDLAAELIEVHKNKAGPSMTAVIGLKGQFSIEEDGAATPTAINVQLDFTFEPTPASPVKPGRPGAEVPKNEPAGAPARVEKGVEGLFDARGFISKLRLAQATTLPLPEGDERLKQVISHELLLERRTAGQSDGGAEPALLPLPDASLAMTQANSWLLYDDPQGRFHFAYPQELKVATVSPDEGVLLVDRRLDGKDLLHISLIPKTGDPGRDRLAADPIQQKRLLEEKWKRDHQKVLPGPVGWLDDPDLARMKRKVFRHEAALVEDESSPGAASGDRVYYDHFIVQFSRNEALDVMAMTKRNPHVNFSKEAEDVIKSFDFGPSEGAVPTASPAGPTPPVTTPAPSALPAPQ
jgi:hypothetical protein